MRGTHQSTYEAKTATMTQRIEDSDNCGKLATLLVNTCQSTVIPNIDNYEGHLLPFVNVFYRYNLSWATVNSNWDNLDSHNQNGHRGH